MIILQSKKKKFGVEGATGSPESEPSDSIFEEGDGESTWAGDDCNGGEECDIGVDPFHRLEGWWSKQEAWDEQEAAAAPVQNAAAAAGECQALQVVGEVDEQANEAAPVQNAAAEGEGQALQVFGDLDEQAESTMEVDKLLAEVHALAGTSPKTPATKRLRGPSLETPTFVEPIDLSGVGVITPTKQLAMVAQKNNKKSKNKK